MYGSNEQGLDEVQAYPYTITLYYIPEVSDLALFTKYYEIGDGVLSFDVVAAFTQPTINTFDTVEAWYREGTNEWKYGGNGDNQIVISGCELGHTYEVRLKVKDRHGNYSQGIIKSVLVELKSEVPNTPQGLGVSFGDVTTFNWLEVRNADIDFYELRYDLHPGQEYGLIGKSNNTTLSTLLTERSAKVYLYAHNPTKGYSAPAELTYNVPIPPKPSTIKIVSLINGIGITTDTIKLGCKGVNIYVDGTRYFFTTNVATIPLESGVHTVQVAFVDLFGEGPRSDEQLATIKAKIDKTLLDMESLGLEGIDKAVNDLKGEVGTVKTAVNGMDSKIIDLGNAYQRTLNDYQNNVNSQITQISSGIDLKVTQAINNIDGAELVSRINLSPAGTRIDGKLLHVTGEALFDNNIIAKGMIQAGAVTADKMQVDSLSSITANVGTLRGGEIIGGTLSNESGSFKVDANGNIVGANITGSRIDAQSIFQAGYKVKSIEVLVYDVFMGDTIPVPDGFLRDECTYVPVGHSVPEVDRWDSEKYTNARQYTNTPMKITFSRHNSAYGGGVTAGITYDYKAIAYSMKTGEGFSRHYSVLTGIGSLYVLCIAKKMNN